MCVEKYRAGAPRRGISDRIETDNLPATGPIQATLGNGYFTFVLCLGED